MPLLLIYSGQGCSVSLGYINRSMLEEQKIVRDLLELEISQNHRIYVALLKSGTVYLKLQTRLRKKFS